MEKENKDKLRHIFGSFGDVDNHLSEIFGSAYLDNSEDTRGEKITPELQEIENNTGGVFHEVSGLIGRSIENAPEIACEQHQQILLNHLRDYMGIETSPISFEEGWATTKHASSCSSPKCRKINAIATWDNVLTPNKMRSRYGEEIENWIID
jgi:hypothetical protein